MDFRLINESDYSQYLLFIEELSKFKSNLSFDEFKKKLEDMKDIYIMVIYDNKLLIGCGSIFIMNKIHCNPIGYIQDVLIDENYRKHGLGKQLVNKLISIGKEKNCYKIILNCHENNKHFYEKCDFSQAGLEMKYIN
jgi:glucosamine-phosphate N-acetyltransferase